MASPLRTARVLAALSLSLGALTLGGGCAAHHAERVQAPDLASALPVLPALEADQYARGGGIPGDPVIALALQGRSWDEALSGGAASLALDKDGRFTLADARWAAWRAGYPFLVRAAATGTGTGTQPPPEIATALATVMRPGDDLGLARARSGEVDTWVALLATPVPGVPSFSRDYTPGEHIKLGLPEGSSWSVVSPSGERVDGATTVDVALDEDGEWWLEAHPPGGLLSVPVYAGMAMPPVPVLELPGADAEGPDSARALAYGVVDQVRSDFGLATLSPDPTLEMLAQAPLEGLEAGTWDHSAAVARLRGAGFVGASTDQVWCQASSVAACIDNLLRSADGRAALLVPAHRFVGAQARVGSDGIRLVIGLAGE